MGRSKSPVRPKQLGRIEQAAFAGLDEVLRNREAELNRQIGEAREQHRRQQVALVRDLIAERGISGVVMKHYVLDLQNGAFVYRASDNGGDVPIDSEDA